MVKLLVFEYDIINQSKKKNKIADALSRREGSQILWTVYEAEEAKFSALSGAEWRVQDKI